jgi:hypothetical protein
MNAISLGEVLQDILDEKGIELEVTNSNRLLMKSLSRDFTITDMSYNMKQITGFFNTVLPIQSEKNSILAASIGFHLSTPILYLISNLGSRCFVHKARTATDNRVVMRIINSFSANFPIISNNAEFSITVYSKSLSDVWFQLVDANWKPIKLLSPMYISAYSEGYEAVTIIHNVDPTQNSLPLETE